MTNEIRILFIELENYRQYYGKHKIEFSSRDEGFTIITGKNGDGKSNLLNSISWCLYHKEPHGMKDLEGHVSSNKSLPVINNRYITELNKGQTAQTSVKIQIQVGDDVYSISRVLQVIKHRLEYKELAGGKRSLLITEHASDKVPSGCEIFNHNRNDFVIKKKSKGDVDFHDTINEGDPNTIMEEILPQGLSKYFLLDGEFLEGFWKNSDTIRDGVEQISQLHLLSSLMDHVDKMRIPSKGAGKDTDELTEKIQSLSWYEKSLDNNGNEKFSEEQRWQESASNDYSYYHATGKPRIKDLLDDIKRMQERLNAIINTMPNINIPSIKLLTDEYTRLEKQFTEAKGDLNSHRKDYRYNLITKSPYIFLKEAIEESVGIIEERMTLGELPVRQRRQFANDLLKRGTCICGEELHSKIIEEKETNSRIIQIEDFRNNLTGKDDLDTAVDMRYDFRDKFIDNYDQFLKLNFGDLRKEFTASEDKYDKLNMELQGIRTQLKDSNNTKTQDMIEEVERLQEYIQNKNNEINSINMELAINTKEQTILKIQLEKGLKKNIKAKQLAHELSVWNKIFAHLDTVYNELNEEIRINVQDSTWRNFQNLLANPNEFKDFKIDDDYSIHLLDQHGFNKIRNLSAGQSLVLTFAFIAALREPTGYKFPLVVDSPLGKIDSRNRYNIGRLLPEYMPEEQLTLLVTDTEYVAYLPPDPEYPDIPTNITFGQILEKKISLKHMRIQKEKDGDNTGNSVIKPAKMEFDKDRQGWVVKTIV